MTEIRRAIVEPGRSELVIERSRFLGYALGASAPEDAQAALAAVRREHPDATHHCYAWRCGPGQERQSDDGEPQATAGLPLLESLRRHFVDYGLLVVVRYYGGRKLGRSGLYRAYLSAGAEALQAACVARLVPGVHYGVEVAHQERLNLVKALEAVDGEVLSLTYGAKVHVEFWLPKTSDLSELVQRCDAAGRADRIGCLVRSRSAADQ
ncbi:MAG: YigZ family protein [Thermaerobacter sp.]|nr:YigZ family protein [Thermaerobacter sp.]